MDESILAITGVKQFLEWKLKKEHDYRCRLLEVTKTSTGEALTPYNLVYINVRRLNVSNLYCIDSRKESKDENAIQKLLHPMAPEHRLGHLR